MMKQKVLFITAEMFPFLPKTEISFLVQKLSRGICERGKEVRNFMPKFGVINERKYQLHEVIRFSGANLVIGDLDYSLFVKVATIPLSRIQVYFVYSKELFQEKNILHDDMGNELPDNDEKSVFFARGVIETVKRLGWSPDLIHCHGWMTALVPLYVKRHYNIDSCFANTKVIYSVYNDIFYQPFEKQFLEKIMIEGITINDIKHIKDKVNFESLTRLAIDFSDGLVQASIEIHPKIKYYIQQKEGLPFLEYQSEDMRIDTYNDFYDQILNQ
ncbi:glycogen/starch synthase [Candidatus Azobacteroides pseudotrichonymphae]|uniref:starch synthase n=1 Tax=Azobacteroides pseudotrichonymphae genomovar. CFP2 TaxID=511995 RepID=B6YS27_AZOPC|nr:glycogen/starch synthase [Candidatus Azobacteroides pseudotrichonymphae]BAG83999.1 glycogen synthase-related protein [Candidatus Azobacteroides pseudotrichonymphae genomovar. CFP2]